LYCVQSVRASNNINNDYNFYEMVVVKATAGWYDIVILMCFYFIIICCHTPSGDVAVGHFRRETDDTFLRSRFPHFDRAGMYYVTTIIYSVGCNRQLAIFDRRKITHRKRWLHPPERTCRFITIFTVILHNVPSTL